MAVPLGVVSARESSGGPARVSAGGYAIEAVLRLAGEPAGRAALLAQDAGGGLEQGPRLDALSLGSEGLGEVELRLSRLPARGAEGLPAVFERLLQKRLGPLRIPAGALGAPQLERRQGDVGVAGGPGLAPRG